MPSENTMNHIHQYHNHLTRNCIIGRPSSEAKASDWTEQKCEKIVNKMSKAREGGRWVMDSFVPGNVYAHRYAEEGEGWARDRSRECFRGRNRCRRGSEVLQMGYYTR